MTDLRITYTDGTTRTRRRVNDRDVDRVAFGYIRRADVVRITTVACCDACGRGAE